MSGELVFNVSKGKIGYYAGLPAANDALILVLLKSSGLVADATMRDYTTLAAILAGASDEADFTGYTRRTLANVVPSVDQANDQFIADADDPAAWTASIASQLVGKYVICYDPDTTSHSDAACIPLVACDFGTGSGVTFDVGVPVSLVFSNTAGSAGFMKAA